MDDPKDMEPVEAESVTAAEAPRPQKESARDLLRPFLELLETLALALILYFAIDAVMARVIVEKISMQPTLQPGNFVLVNKLAYKLGGEPRTGEIVIFHNPMNRSEDYVKRIIGVPGDDVLVTNGKVYVNRVELNEPYISAAPQYSGEWTVPPDSLFVLGDNRNESYDSHDWGFVPMSDVVGKALVVYWPLDSIKVISHANSLPASAAP